MAGLSTCNIFPGIENPSIADRVWQLACDGTRFWGLMLPYSRLSGLIRSPPECPHSRTLKLCNSRWPFANPQLILICPPPLFGHTVEMHFGRQWWGLHSSIAPIFNKSAISSAIKIWCVTEKEGLCKKLGGFSTNGMQTPLLTHSRTPGGDPIFVHSEECCTMVAELNGCDCSCIFLRFELWTWITR